MENKICICGSRDMEDYDFLKEKVNSVFEENNFSQLDTAILSGKANGADTLGEDYANEFGYEVKEFPADWKQYGKAAGHKRNREMAEEATIVIAFKFPDSKGTENMIRQSKELGKKVIVFDMERPEVVIPEGDPIEIYTDGSNYPNPGSGGWACVLFHKSGRVEKYGYVGDSVTNNQAELEAIFQGLKSIKKEFMGNPITINSDSQWSIGACSGQYKKLKKNLDKIKEIRDYISQNGLSITWNHVRGHQDNEWNNRCDELANLGRTLPKGKRDKPVIDFYPAQPTEAKDLF